MRTSTITNGKLDSVRLDMHMQSDHYQKKLFKVDEVANLKITS